MSSSQSLTNFNIQALCRRRHKAAPLAANIADEPLVMVDGDIKAHNFLIDPETLRVTIIDFGGISALPHSFVSYTLHRTRDIYHGYQQGFGLGTTQLISGDGSGCMDKLANIKRRIW